MTLEEARGVRTTVIAKTGGCYMVIFSGQPISLHRRQSTCLLNRRVGSGGGTESGDRCQSESRGARAADDGTRAGR